jgi:hypothetical protein
VFAAKLEALRTQKQCMSVQQNLPNDQKRQSYYKVILPLTEEVNVLERQPERRETVTYTILDK